MPQATAHQALGCREEKASSDEDVKFGGVGKSGRNWVKVEGDGEDNDESDSVGPDVDGFVRKGGEARLDTFELVLCEAVSTTNVWVDTPRLGQDVVSDETLRACEVDSLLDPKLQGFLCSSCSVGTLVHDVGSLVRGVVHGL